MEYTCIERLATLRALELEPARETQQVKIQWRLHKASSPGVRGIQLSRRVAIVATAAPHESVRVSSRNYLIGCSRDDDEHRRG